MMERPRKLTNRPGVLAVVALCSAASLVSGCGETYINERATVSTAATVAPTVATISPDATVDSLLGTLNDELATLSEAIIQRRQPERIGGHIDTLWAAIQARTDDEVLIANGSRIVELAHTAIDRNRPADADKANRLLGEQIANRSASDEARPAG